MEGPALPVTRASRLPQAPGASPALQGVPRTPSSAVDDSQVLSNDLRPRIADDPSANIAAIQEHECMSLVSHAKQQVSGSTLNGRRLLTSKPTGAGPTAGSTMQLDDINLSILQPRPPEGKPLQLAMPKLDLAKLRVRTDAAEQVEMEAAARAQSAIGSVVSVTPSSQPAARPASASAYTIKAPGTSHAHQPAGPPAGKGNQRTHGIPTSPGFKTPQQKAGKAAVSLHASPAALAARTSIGGGPAKKAPYTPASPVASPALSPVEALRGKVAKPSSPSSVVRKSVTRLQNKKAEPESTEKLPRQSGTGLVNTYQQGDTRASMLRRSASAQKRTTLNAGPNRPATATAGQSRPDERPRSGSATRTRGVVVGSPGQGMRANHVRRSGDIQAHQVSNTPTVSSDTANKPLSSKMKAGAFSILSAIPERLQTLATTGEPQQHETPTAHIKPGTKPQFQLNFAALRPSMDPALAPEHPSSDRISSAGSTGKPSVPKLNLVPLMQQQEAEQYVGDAYAMSPEELANIKTAHINLPRKNGAGARKAMTPDPPPQDHFYFYPKLDPEYERAMLHSVALLPRKEQQQWRALLNEAIQAKQNCEAIAFRGHRLLDQMKDHHKEQAQKQQEELERKAELCEVLQDEVAYLRAQLAQLADGKQQSSQDQGVAGLAAGADTQGGSQDTSEGARKVESDNGLKPYVTIRCAKAAAMLGNPDTPHEEANDASTNSRQDQNQTPEKEGSLNEFMSQQLQATQQQLQRQLDSLNKSMRQSSWTSDTSHGSSVAHRHVWSKKDQPSHVSSATRQGSSSATAEDNWQPRISTRLQQVTTGRDISVTMPDGNDDQDVQDQDVDSNQDNVAALLEQLRKDLQQRTGRALSFGNDVAPRLDVA